MNRPLLEVNNLTVQFRLKRGTLTAVNNVCFTIDEKETLGIVGETGCGKSATALSILRLISSPSGRIVGGEILFEGDDLLRKSEHEMERIRGNKISMIFQEPMTSFNPSFTIGEQIAESYRIHLRHSKKSRAGVDGTHSRRRAGAVAANHHGALSAPAERRHEAESDDRHGAGLPTQIADRR